jgi:hypothetical protein
MASHGTISIYYEWYEQGHERDKLRVARAYNKRVKEKSFQVRDLVWKMILPIGSKSNKLEKWSPNWEELYRIEEVIPENSYMVHSV